MRGLPGLTSAIRSKVMLYGDRIPLK